MGVIITLIYSMSFVWEMKQEKTITTTIGRDAILFTIYLNT